MRGHRQLIRGLFLAILSLFSLGNPRPIVAHPMGNFSISHYSGIRLEPGFVEIRYLIDMAEIPTYQEIQNTGIVAKEGDPSLPAYLLQKAESLAAGLSLQLNGQALRLQLVSQSVIFPAGAGGLPTMKLGFVYRAALEDLAPGSACAVKYRDDNFEGRAGWKEIVVTAEPGFQLAASSVPSTDRSAQLSNYPTDLLSSPPQDLQAAFSFVPSLTAISAMPAMNAIHPAQTRPAVNAHRNPPDSPSTSNASRARVVSPPSARATAPIEPPSASSPNTTSSAAAPPTLQPNQQATPRNRFTELISAKNLSFWFLLTAALIAAGLGALHALEPGHGKTIVAAYLVGSKGTARHAVLLGLIVTATHTAGVYLLGAVTLYASKYIVPEHLYPWLGMISGLIIAVLASYLMIRAWTGEDGNHSHEPGSAHTHWFASFGRSRTAEKIPSTPLDDGGSEIAGGKKTVSLTQLLTLGITGGIVPCPAALVVLLGAFSLHRLAFGLFLIVAFSLGLAAILIAIGLLMVYARQVLARWRSDGPITRRWLPLISAGFMLILGLGIAGRALLSTGIGSGFLVHGKLTSLVGIVLLGLFLGIRHSTDPDHVVAVSTIASRERSVGQGALIGMLWGVGHTLTIFLVGSAIILFGLVIPPRVGLSMEFGVALMLITLGILNLTGTLRWLAERFSPTNRGDISQVPSSASAADTREGRLDALLRRYGSYQVFRPLVIGLVHGLAGSAAVALLVLSTIRTPLWAIAYLLVFGVGTIIGMMLMTSAMAIPVAYTGKRFEVAAKYLTSISGVVSTGFGLFLVYQIGFVDGLFKSTVHWTPQ
jgi:ABC-type nickel/cobalt efflux system permease component RcnA/high-affinity nickel permease